MMARAEAAGDADLLSQVWADTRETIFKGLESWYRHAYDKPPAFRCGFPFEA